MQNQSPVLNRLRLECLICLSMFLPNFLWGLGLQQNFVPLHQLWLLRSIFLIQKSWQSFGKMSHGFRPTSWTAKMLVVSPVWWLQISCCICLQHSYSRDGTTLCCVGRLEFCKQRGASAAHCISFGRQLCHCVAWSMELPERPRLQSINGLVLSNEFPCCTAFVQSNPRVEATWSLPLCCWKSILAASCSSSAPRRSEMGIWLLAVNFLAYQKRLRECDQRVCVPQQQGHSLNVAHACSIYL